MLPKQRNQLTISILSRLRKEGAPEASAQNPAFDMDKSGFASTGDEDQMNEREVMLGDEELDSNDPDADVKSRRKKARQKPGPVSEY